VKRSPRVVVIGGGAGLATVLTGLAAHLRGGPHDGQHDLLTAIVPGAGDLEDAEALVGHCACVLPATVDAGPARRVYPETLRRIINADLIIAGPCDRAVLEVTLSVGGIGATLPAVNAVRVVVIARAEDRWNAVDAGFAAWLSTPRLFDYWLPGSPAPDGHDDLMDNLHALLASHFPGTLDIVLPPIARIH
jgi:hypothetical protein